MSASQALDPGHADDDGSYDYPLAGSTLETPLSTSPRRGIEVQYLISLVTIAYLTP